MTRLLIAAAAGLLALPVAAGQPPLPIIDMHLHALPLSDFGGGMAICTNEGSITYPGVDPRQPLTFDRVMPACEAPLPAPKTDAAVMADSLAMLRKHNIWAIVAGPLDRVGAWKAAEPERVIPALSFSDPRARTPAEVRRLHRAGKFAVLAEIGAQYRGLSLADKAYEPFFALAEELDIPVGVHLGEGPPGAPYVSDPPYRARLGSPLQLEDILVRHPRLRLYVMHYGSPFVDEMIAVLYSHPQVYVDIAQNNWGFPRAHFHAQLRKLVDAGFGTRILWGSDQMIWPETIRIAMETVESAGFLTAEQKRDIFYNNAARFLRLDQATIDRHHGRR